MSLCFYLYIYLVSSTPFSTNNKADGTFVNATMLEGIKNKNRKMVMLPLTELSLIFKPKWTILKLPEQ